MIETFKNGYLAEPFSADDLAKGIEWVINNPRYLQLRQNAREKVLNEFGMDSVAQRYKEVYEKILAE
jgi:glycosyltransferase involved in cell wall biosynthesis